MRHINRVVILIEENKRLTYTFLIFNKQSEMADFNSICDQILSDEDINVKNWREMHQLQVLIIEAVFSYLPVEFEALVTGFQLFIFCLFNKFSGL